MNTHTFVDKSEWGAGEWESEPDAAYWTDERSGYQCLIVRADLGHLCGYVVLPEGHPMHGKPMEDFRPYRAHGGITLAAVIHPDLAREVMGDPNLELPPNGWLVGFDCGHDYDHTPAAAAEFAKLGLFGPRGIYRNWDFVRAEVDYLADQLRASAKEPMEAVNS